MLELLGLPHVPRVVLEHPPLALALCQVRFARVLGVADPKNVAPFQRAIQSQYPFGGSARQVELEVAVEDAGESALRVGTRAHQWRFTDQHNNWTVVLAEDFVALETHAYEDFSDFLSRLREVLEAVAEHIQPSAGTRIGLRYLNEIRPGHRDWSAVIRPELLGPLAVAELQDRVQQAIQQLTLRYPDNQGINIRHGVLTGAVVRPRPGEKLSDESFYLLDFDAFREFPSTGPLLMAPGSICEHVEMYNQVIYRLFRWSVTEDYIATLGLRRYGDREPHS